MIEDVFGTEGFLAREFEGYAPRKGQVDMARAIEEAIATGTHAIAEGPTGTGKSLAYLVPSIYAATRDPKKPGRVIVVTGNIALQEQLVEKDLPMLQRVLKDRKFQFCLSKGKNNYACLDSLEKTRAKLAASADVDLEAILDWADSTETGDVSELEVPPPPALWRKVSTSSDECKGSSCKHFEDCFAERAKRLMYRSHVVVTNYHMFFAHLRVREKMKAIQATGAPVEIDVVLPPADVIVFDEAHKAADIARDFLGFQLTRGRVDWLVRDVDNETAGAAKMAANRFFDALLEHRRSRSYRARLKKGHPIDGEPLARALDRAGAFYKAALETSAWDPDQRAEVEMRLRASALMSSQVREAMTPEKSPGIVYFVEEVQGPAGGCVLKSKPIQVADWLHRELFRSFQTVAVTSATLATSDRGGFSFVRGELGLVGDDLPKVSEMVAESPFDWAEQVAICIPEDLGDPKNYETFPDSVAEQVCRIAKYTGGRVLGLFTSFRVLERTYRAMIAARFGFRTFKQGEAPRTKLVNRFKEDVSSCLLGCESFWAGVDVPGESLSCVVIDRLPFPTPEDPIVDAIAEKDDRWFFNYAVPRGIIQFKQGFGRLIRTTTDRGIVVVLDRRIVDMGYGRSFLASLPKGIQMTRDLSKAARWLAA
jgi:ATP-dependent DNA helicase DinG